MRGQQFVYYLAISAVLIHFVANGTMPKLLRQGARLGGTASHGLQGVARAI